MLNKARDFLEGNINYLQKDSLPSYMQEQISLRAYLCSDCMALGRCKICNCPTPKLFYAPNKIDEDQKGGEFLSETQGTALKANIDGYSGFIKNLLGESTDSNSSSEFISDNT